MPAKIITDPKEVTAAVFDARKNGQKVGLVPTMGALHDGHLSLAKAAKAENDLVVTTIFVNPTQFAEGEDLEKYPRDLNGDANKLGETTDIIFAPTPNVMYPKGFSTYVTAPDVAKKLEGEKRPTHFQGVTTIVTKLFNIAPADAAYFGQKDYQQTLVIKRMVEDLNQAIKIQVCPIVRDPDGMAMSSRNAYLSEKERAIGLSLSKALKQAELAIKGDEKKVGHITDLMKRVLTEAGVAKIDYACVCDPRTLDEPQQIEGKVVLLVAAFVGKTRLIDNCIVE